MTNEQTYQQSSRQKMNTACIKYLGSSRVNLANFLSFTFLELSVCVYTQEKNAKYIKCALDSPCEKLSGSCRTKKIRITQTCIYLYTHACTLPLVLRR